jgi:hypothetical protein
VGLYSRCYFGTKQLVDEFVEEVCFSLDTLYHNENLKAADRQQFFKKASKSFGRSALCLSGGATFGYYHLGVVKALVEHDVLPKVITGTSAGSLIAAFVCVRTDEELKRELTPDLSNVFTACDISWFQFLKNLYNTGAGFDPEHWMPKMEVVTNGIHSFTFSYCQMPLSVDTYINERFCR